MADDNNLDAELEQLRKRYTDLGYSYDQVIKMLNQSRDINKHSAADLSKTIDAVKKSLAEGGLTADELADELTELRKQIVNTTNQDKIQSLLNQKAELEQRNARNKATEALTNSFWSTSGALAAGATKAAANIAKSALTSGDSLSMAGSMMESGVDLVNTANQGGANALKSFGAATAGARGPIGKLGIASVLAGEGLSLLSNTVSELAKAGIGFMITQTKELITGFQTMSAVGAVYTGGMSAMIDTSLAAGMTLGQFSKAVSANSDNLAKTGLGVAAASKRMAGAMDGTSKAGIAARNGMFALGMGMEEQAEAYAATMALMAGPSGKLKASNAEVSTQTQEYAKNLKLISSLTGQDAKARMEKVRQDNDTLAFNAVLNKMGETERKKTVEAMALMSDADARAFREKKIYGAVISEDLAASRAINQGIAKTQDEIFAASEQHALDIQVVGKAYQRNSAETLRSANEAGTNLGRARSGAAVDISKSMNETAQHAAKMSDATKTAAAIAEVQNKGKEGKGGLEVDVMVKQQETLVALQGLANKNLPLVAKALDLTHAAAMKAVEGLLAVSTAAGNNPIAALTSALLPVIASIATMAAGMSIGKGAMGKGAGGGSSTGDVTGGDTKKSKGLLAKISKGNLLRGGIAGVASTAGYAAGESLTKSGHETMGGWANVLSAAGAGAAMGSIGGPVGTLIGGAGGLMYGLYENRDAPLWGGNKATTAPKPVANVNKQALAEQQNKLTNANAMQADATKKAMEKPPSSATPAEQQQITLLQNILASMEQNTKLTAGILRNA